jgi:hypothetical protein
MIKYTISTPEALMKQGAMTADYYLDWAVEKIDAKFGAGFAAKNPALVAGFMQTAAADFHAAMINIAAQIVAEGK